jgi:hypothetical protein
MRVTSFLACQFASHTVNGLTDLGGIGLDQIQTSQFPIRLALKFFARVESDMNDIAGKHRATMVLMGDDKTLSKHVNEFQTTEEKRNTNLIVDFLLKFDAPGSYRVDLLIDDQPGASWPLTVSQMTGMPPQGPPQR